MRKIYLFKILATLAVLTASFTLLSIKCAKTEAVDLVYQKVATASSVDGIDDGIWADAETLVKPLSETDDPPHDLSKIINCADCHASNSDGQGTLKSVNSTERIYILPALHDAMASFTRGGSWSFVNDSWDKPNSEQSEDRVSFFWPTGEINGDPYRTGSKSLHIHLSN